MMQQQMGPMMQEMGPIMQQMGPMMQQMRQRGVAPQDMWNQPEFQDMMNRLYDPMVQQAREAGDDRPEAEIRQEMLGAAQMLLQPLIPGLNLLGGMAPPEPHVDAAAWIGQHVVLQNLVSQPGMNGKVGKVSSYDQQRRRFLVLLEGDDRAKAFKPTNIRMARRVEYLPLPEAIDLALSSDLLDDLDVVRQRAADVGRHEAGLADKAIKRYQVRKVETDKALAELSAFKDRGVPPLDDARAKFQQELHRALEVAIQARLPDSDLEPFRKTLVACYSVVLENAREGQSAEVLESAMQTARNAMDVLGPLGVELDKEHAVAAEYLSEVKAAEQRKSERQTKQIPDIPVPHEFLCPLTHGTMRDPVVAADGNTYEREAIEQYFERYSKSPLTQEPLKNKEVVPNNALKKLIRSHEETVQKSLVTLHDEVKLEREISRDNHREEKKSLEAQLKKLQQADAADESIDALTENVFVAAMVRSCSGVLRSSSRRSLSSQNVTPQQAEPAHLGRRTMVFLLLPLLHRVVSWSSNQILR
jgi:gluconate kinase